MIRSSLRPASFAAIAVVLQIGLATRAPGWAAESAGDAQGTRATPSPVSSSETGAAEPTKRADGPGPVLAPSRPPAMDPKAIEILQASSARLAAAKSLSFTATAEYESPSRLGPPLVYTTISDVTLARPDKLRVITPGDGSPSEFYYDGKVMMAYAPAEDLVAIASAPATVDEALKQAYQSAAIYFPFTDVVVADPYGDLAPMLRKAFYIGQSKVVGGTTTDVVGIVTDHLFGQMWIGAEDKLPRAYRVTYLDDPQRLRQAVAFSNWKLGGEPDASVFTSAKAAAGKPVQFARPDPQIPQAVLDAMKQPAGTPVPKPAKKKH